MDVEQKKSTYQLSFFLFFLGADTSTYSLYYVGGETPINNLGPKRRRLSLSFLSCENPNDRLGPPTVNAHLLMMVDPVGSPTEIGRVLSFFLSFLGGEYSTQSLV